MSKLTNPNFPVGLEESPLEDRRNVIDRFKYWELDAIRAELDKDRRPFSVMLENFGYDINIATSIRNGNAFLPEEIWITGRKRYDKRGSMGTYHYEHIFHALTSKEVIEAKKEAGSRIVVFDNIDGAEDLRDYKWDPSSLMIFGQEDIGVSQAALDLADDVVYIPQFGSTRSINVGCATSIAMYDYASKVRY